MSDAATVVTRAATAANAAHLAPTFPRRDDAALRRERARAPGARWARSSRTRRRSLWRRDWIEAHRVERVPGASAHRGRGRSAGDGDGQFGRVRDRRRGSRRGRARLCRWPTARCRGASPHVWARAAVAAYQDFMADRVVAEVNQGGDLVVAVMRQIDRSVPVRKVRATRGKWVRAEPVAALYAEGRVAHVGRLDVLEDQMCAFGADGLAGGRSPDRVDALVWALTDLMLERTGAPSVRMI